MKRICFANGAPEFSSVISDSQIVDLFLENYTLIRCLAFKKFSETVYCTAIIRILEVFGGPGTNTGAQTSVGNDKCELRTGQYGVFESNTIQSTVVTFFFRYRYRYCDVIGINSKSRDLID